MTISDNEKKKYEQAKKRVEEIKGFYTHLIIYVLVNIFLLLAAMGVFKGNFGVYMPCLLYTSPSPRDRTRSRMPSSA